MSYVRIRLQGGLLVLKTGASYTQVYMVVVHKVCYIILYPLIYFCIILMLF